MKSTSPNPVTFNPEVSAMLSALKFIHESLGIKDADVNTVPAPTTEEPKKNPFHVHPDFPFSVSRSLEGMGDQEMEVAIEVVHYRPPGNNRGLDHRDPQYEAGEVTFGDAVVVSTGKTIELSQLEWEAAESAFWN